MLGKLIRSFTGSDNGTKAINILRNTYSLEVSHPEQVDMMRRIAVNFSEFYNDHEMAVQFLAEFARTIQIDHPLARREMEKYIRMSKGAYKRGLIQSDAVMVELFKVAKDRFGIDPDAISAT